ncbi:hypothetical protein GCM10025768_04420 [Microbacterium pseudoresistens]|uniref:ABC-type transport system involved in multi-copper enzyme maturation permease subunit n=1 Tax=Microbacterium pseudoresistens TaxID=640634 RepID=A0A7Y9JN74_9MICO|nr:ABC transporter permease [Microbacterium pseudoresistens]NYD54278.1 ABC-type transport system involved in multi-copper enzyme maturation permease subunit [Microbacterium pseudoresistens]
MTGVSMTRVLRSEGMKFSTLRSNIVTAAAAFTLIVGIAAVLIWARTGDPGAPGAAVTDLLNGVTWAQMVLVVLAVVAICSEWSTGMSRVTFLAVPTRGRVVVAKALIVGAVSFLVGVMGAAAALAAGAFAAGIDTMADPALSARLLAGSGLSLAALAVFALGIGALVRNLVAGILTVAGILWVLPFAVAMIPVPEVQKLVAYLPGTAAGALIAPDDPAAALTPWGGLAVLAVWMLVALSAAVVTVRTRDV